MVIIFCFKKSKIIYFVGDSKTDMEASQKNNIEFVNVGSGKGIKIKNLVKIIANIVDFKGKTFYNKNSPDGHPKKILDISLAKKLGFQYETKLEAGIKKTYLDFIKNQ